MDDHSKQYYFTELVLCALQGEISADQIKQLNSVLKDNPARICEYLELMDMYSELSSLGSVELSEYTPEINFDVLHALAEDAKTAPTIKLPPKKTLEQTGTVVIRPSRDKKSVSKLSIFTLICSAAALLFLVLFLKFSPGSAPRIEVATLSDQINAQWTDLGIKPKTGERLWTNDGLLDLKKGIVKIKYDSGVDVLIEGPAIFELERSGIYLEYGRLYSQVSESGHGFKVETPSSQFIDMGTEFGIQADLYKSSELHVIKGKVQLFAGARGGSRAGRMVTENNAVRYNSSSDKITEVPIQKETLCPIH